MNTPDTERLIRCIERLTNTVAANTRAIEGLRQDMQPPEEQEQEETEQPDGRIRLIDGSVLEE